MTTNTIVQKLGNWFGKPINKIPPELRAIALAYIPGWEKQSASERRARAAEVDRQRLVKANIKLARVRRQQARDANDPLKVAEGTIGWWDGKNSMSASYWWGQPVVHPPQAAMLLCQLNPNHVDVSPEGHWNGETGKDEYKELLGYFNALELTQPGHRTLEQWVCIAQRENLKYHSWIDKYLSALDLLAANKGLDRDAENSASLENAPSPGASAKELAPEPSSSASPKQVGLVAEWITKSITLANEIGHQKWLRGEREITARNMCGAVAIELAKGEPDKPQIYHGSRGPRAAGTIRNQALSGWRFELPSGTSGTTGTS